MVEFETRVLFLPPPEERPELILYQLLHYHLAGWIGVVLFPSNATPNTPMIMWAAGIRNETLSENLRQKCPIPDSALPKYSWLPYHTICSYCLVYLSLIPYYVGRIYRWVYTSLAHGFPTPMIVLMHWRWFHVPHYRNCLLQNLFEQYYNSSYSTSPLPFNLILWWLSIIISRGWFVWACLPWFWWLLLETSTSRHSGRFFSPSTVTLLAESVRRFC